ncbi:patatin-like phospholipase domain-containing protein 4 isoform X6 [Pseudorca crassidens]|uniref:patatin-like phospholipase domain-containing protein 4 isoform X6 n=1 Tax=Pseudorca crassidens TaxID=82174 RepID=UPI00352DB635
MTGWEWRGTKFYTEMPQTCIARMKHINLSFAACGFLGIYHLGAASALYKHGQKLLKNVKAFAGASAGSLVASVLLTAPQKIEVLLASSFVPIYAGLKPVEYKGQKWVDGCFTNSLPLLPVGRTVTVSAFSGRVDISPQDEGQLDFYVTIAKQHILILHYVSEADPGPALPAIAVQRVRTLRSEGTVNLEDAQTGVTTHHPCLKPPTAPAAHKTTFSIEINCTFVQHCSPSLRNIPGKAKSGQGEGS